MVDGRDHPRIRKSESTLVFRHEGNEKKPSKETENSEKWRHSKVLEAKHVFQRRNNDQMLLRDLVRWRLRINHWVWQWGGGAGEGETVIGVDFRKWEKKFVYWVKTNFEEEFYCREKGSDRGGFWGLEKRFLKIKRCLNSGGHDSAERIQEICWWEREWWQTRP